MLRVSRGARFVRLPAIPPHIWEIITHCWRQGPEMRPTFWELLTDFHTNHGYILDGANRDAVLRYEEKVYRACGPAVGNAQQEPFLTPERSAEFGRRIDALLAKELPDGRSSAVLGRSTREWNFR
jgi:hypothetical protein